MSHRGSVIMCFLLFMQLQFLRGEFVEFHNDFKSNHIEDEVNYSFHYYIDHAPSRVFVNHREQRRGTQVLGQYGLVEPDGSVRNVYYEADKGKGYRAIVQTRTAASRTYQLLQLPRRQATAPLWRAEPVAFVL